MVESVIADAFPAAVALGRAQAAAGGTVGDLPAAPASDQVARRDLLELLAAVSDGRPGQGRDHPVSAVLALAAGAVVAGMRSFTAIADWVADVPPGVAAQLYQRCGAARPAAGPPSKCTIWRVVTGAGAPALDAVIGAWLMRRGGAAEDSGGEEDPAAALVPVRVDGKTIRGAKNAEGSQVHLLAALAGEQGVVAAQAEVGPKTNLLTELRE